MFRFDTAGYHHAIYVLTEAIGIVREGSAKFPAVAINEKSTQDMLANLGALNIRDDVLYLIFIVF